MVWIVHNLQPHDAKRRHLRLWKPYIRALTRYVDAVLALSPGTIAQIHAEYPDLANKPTKFVWHPAYANAALPDFRRYELRAARGFDSYARVVGYCGRICPYKGLDRLATSFWRTSDPHFRLLIAGKASQGTEVAKLLEAVTKTDSRIKLDFRHFTNIEYCEALCCCDIVVSTFIKYLHSGSIIHALSARRPVLTPSTPFSDALSSEVGSNWVRTYSGELNAGLIEFAFENLPSGSPPLESFAPDLVGAKAANWFRSL